MAGAVIEVCKGRVERQCGEHCHLQGGGLWKASWCWRTSRCFPSRHVGWWYLKETKLHEQRCPKLPSSSPPPTAPPPLLPVSVNRTPPPHHHPHELRQRHRSLPCLLPPAHPPLTHADSTSHTSLKSSSLSLHFPPSL